MAKDETLEGKVNSVDPVLNYKGSIMRRIAEGAQAMPKKVKAFAAGLLTIGMLYNIAPIKARAQETKEITLAYNGAALLNENGWINKLDDFLDTCPQDDPAFETINNDFILTHSTAGIPTIINPQNVYCQAPYSKMNVADVTEELIIQQSLRVAFYAGKGSGSLLEWYTNENINDTSAGPIYKWLKEHVGGFEVNDGSQNPGHGYVINGKKQFVVLPRFQDYAKALMQEPRGPPGLIGLFLHEASHIIGQGHDGTCGYGVDSDFDESKPTPFSADWRTYELFLTGEFNVGINCMDQSKAQDTLAGLLNAANARKDGFCGIKPPVLTMPANAGGACNGLVTGELADSFGDTIENMTIQAYNVPGDFIFATTNSGNDGLFKIARLIGHYNLDVSSGDKCFNNTSFDIGSIVAEQNFDLGTLTMQHNELAAPNITLNGSCVAGKPCNFAFSDTFGNSVYYDIDAGNGKTTLPKDQKSVTVSYPTPGTKTLTAEYSCAQHGTLSASSTLEFTVSQASGPDTKIDFTIEPSQTCNKKGKCKINATASIQNTGDQKSGTSTIQFFTSPNPILGPEAKYLTQKNVPAQKPGTAKTINLSTILPAGTNATGQYVYAVIQTTYDTNPENNTARSTEKIN
ncbi:MAG: hypothetical protein V1837_08175 [Candidatus Woesearchaeota archaeon]